MNDLVGLKDVVIDEELAYVSFKNFVSSNEYLGLPVEDFENKDESLLRELKAKGGHREVGAN